MRWAGCFDWLGTSHVLSSMLWWWWCVIPRPSLVLGFLITFLLFFLPGPGWPRPASPFIITIIFITGIPTLLDIIAQLTSWFSVYWPLWLATVAGPGQYHWTLLYPWCTPELLPVQFLDSFSPCAVGWTCWACFVFVLALVWWGFGLQHVLDLCIRSLGSLLLR